MCGKIVKATRQLDFIGIIGRVAFKELQAVQRSSQV